MDDNKDLKALEKKAWRSMFEDGLWEIIIGVLAFTNALGITLDELGANDPIRMAITYPLMFMGVPILYLGKRFMTIPRTGIVKFSHVRQERKTVMLFIMIAALLITIGIWVAMASLQVDTSLYGSIMITILIFAMFCSFAYYFDQKRFYLIAVLMGIGEPTLTYLRGSTDITYTGVIAWGIPAMMILLMGFVAMGQFLRNNPLPMEDDGEAPNAA